MVNPQERKPQAQRNWLDLLQGRAYNVHKVDVCACSFVLRETRLFRGARLRCSLFSCGMAVANRGLTKRQEGFSLSFT